MSKYDTLANPPIQQALIGVMVEPVQPFANLERIPPILSKKYPLCEPFHNKSVFINIAPEGDIKSQNIHGTQQGYNLFSENRKKQINVSTLNVVMLDAAKYKNGEHLIKQYREIWNAYIKYTKPERLKRVGLRYINHFFMTPTEADKNLQIKPVINFEGKSKLLLAGLAGQYAVRSDLYRANGNLAISATPQPNGKLSITFDIDVFDQEIPYVDFASIEDTLNRLRDFKNQLFFDNITDARKRFK